MCFLYLITNCNTVLYILKYFFQIIPYFFIFSLYSMSLPCPAFLFKKIKINNALKRFTVLNFFITFVQQNIFCNKLCSHCLPVDRILLEGSD